MINIRYYIFKSERLYAVLNNISAKFYLKLKIRKFSDLFRKIVKFVIVDLCVELK